MSEKSQQQTQWHAITNRDVEGRGWDKTEYPFGRLPTDIKEQLPDNLWALSHSPTGMCVKFTTDSTAIHARWELASVELGEANFPVTCYSGLDLYAKDQNVWRWAGCVANQVKDQHPTVTLIDKLDGKQREYMLYLPARNPVLSLEIGVDHDSQYQLIPPRPQRPIVFYGSSIVHGAYASHAGIIHPSLLGRWLDRPVINLGFSGCAKMELGIAECLGELTSCLYVIDPLPNMNGPMVEEFAEPFLNALINAQPQTPILMVEDRTMTNAWIQPHVLAEHRSARRAYRRVYDELKNSRHTNLWYLKGDELLGTDSEASLDGSHPSDLGYMRMAQCLLPVIKDILGS